MKKETSKLSNAKANNHEPVQEVVYSDGNDYSHLIKSAYYTDPKNECCQCGSTLINETDEADICHNCGFVYT